MNLISRESTTFVTDLFSKIMQPSSVIDICVLGEVSNLNACTYTTPLLSTNSSVPLCALLKKHVMCNPLTLNMPPFDSSYLTQ